MTPRAGRVGQYPRYLRAGTIEPLVWVAPPVGEQQQVACSQSADTSEQLSKVRGAVQQRTHPVPGGPGGAVGVAGIQPGGGVAAFTGGEKPSTEASVSRCGARPCRPRRAGLEGYRAGLKRAHRAGSKVHAR